MKKAFFYLLGIFLSLNSFSQNATIRGFVYDKANLEPIPSVNVLLKGTKYNVISDGNGFYSIASIPAGTYTMIVTFIGYDTIVQTITLKPGDLITKKYFLKESVTLLGDVDITVKQEQKTKEVNISIIPVTVEDIKRVPSVGGEPDIAQYLQILPGVNFTGDQGGQLYIRGGTPVQNKVLLDGMIIYNPFHSIGLFSVFDADIIRGADVYTGGFNAEYGGRISSIMDITTRDGNKKHFRGKVSASPFVGKALLEGPLFKKKPVKSEFSSSEEVKLEIDKFSKQIDSLNAVFKGQDSITKKLIIERNKINANILKISADTNFKTLVGPLNDQLKKAQRQVDSINLVQKENRSQVDKRYQKITQLNKELTGFETEGGSTSYLVSCKGSYLDRSSKLFYSYVDKNGLPYSFLDLYGKTSFNSTSGSKLNLYGFNFTDNVDYQFVSNIKWSSYGGGSNFVLVPQNSPLLIEGAFSYSRYFIEMVEADSLPRSSEIKGFNMGLTFTYFKGNSTIKYGVEALGYTTDFNFYNVVHRHIQQKENTTELAGFIKAKIIGKKKKLVAEPSLRLHYYAALRNFSPEPRFGMKYNAADKLRVKFAGGFYSQNLISATSDRDVVNLFYGFLSGPDNLQSTFLDESGNTHDVKHNLQKAWHAIGGIEYDVTKHIEVNLEAYWKQFTQLTNINRNKLFDDDAEHTDVADALKKDFIIETGSARGIDLLVKYDYKRLYIWAVYSLGFVNRWDGIVSYVPHFDRRHNMNLVVAYQFGKDRDWEVDLRWNFGSGFPFTKTAGFYENIVFNGGINSNYTNTNYDPNNPSGSNSQLGILYGELNGGRLPYYHRLDMNIKKKWELSENSTLECTVGATNVYNRANIFYFDRIRYKRVNQLPILPSVALSWTF